MRMTRRRNLLGAPTALSTAILSAAMLSCGLVQPAPDAQEPAPEPVAVEDEFSPILDESVITLAPTSQLKTVASMSWEPLVDGQDVFITPQVPMKISGGTPQSVSLTPGVQARLRITVVGTATLRVVLEQSTDTGKQTVEIPVTTRGTFDARAGGQEPQWLPITPGSRSEPFIVRQNGLHAIIHLHIE